MKGREEDYFLATESGAGKLKTVERLALKPESANVTDHSGASLIAAARLNFIACAFGTTALGTVNQNADLARQ